jgi:hypothetical protein
LDEDDIEACTKEGLSQFINFAKPQFDGTEDTVNIKVGKRRLNKPSIHIQAGRMKLTGCVKYLSRSCYSQTVFRCIKRCSEIGL